MPLTQIRINLFSIPVIKKIKNILKSVRFKTTNSCIFMSKLSVYRKLILIPITKSYTNLSVIKILMNMKCSNSHGISTQ